MSYKVLFRMPKDPELFIAAYAAISAYERKVKAMPVAINITLITEDNWLTQLLVHPSIFIAESIEETLDIKYDLVVDMSEERVKSLAREGRTAASICGTFVGLEHVNETQINLSKLSKEYSEGTVAVISWGENSSKLITWLRYQFGINVRCLDEKEFYGVEEINSFAALKCNLVIGRRSVATYLAAIAGKVVIELYSLEQYDRDFLAKWSSPKYQALYAKRDSDLDNGSEAMWNVVKQTIERTIKQYNIVKPLEAIGKR